MNETQPVKGDRMIEQHYLNDVLRQLKKLKSLAEKSIVQVDDEQLFAVLDSEANSIAMIMKHIAGNMRSRWTDFLTTDGEKPDRDRESEFVVESGATRAGILMAWENGWRCVLETVSSLGPEDLAKNIRIRGEVHSVLEAINRQMMHYASHVGQIVLLAKHYAGSGWRSLSIPRGKSQEYDVSKEGNTYGAARKDRT
jgi:hypothetical protein